MSPAQNKEYWRRWGQVRKVLIELGEFSKADADAERKVIHLEVLKQEKSSKDLSNDDLDAIFDAFDKYLVLQNGPSNGTPRAKTGPLSRLIWSIDSLGLADEYLNKIAADTFGVTSWRDLDLQRMEKFRFTATSRARALKKKADPADPS